LRQFASFGGQLAYAGLLIVPAFLLDAEIISIIAAILCAVWYAVVMPFIFRKLPEVPARRSLDEVQGRSMVTIAFQDVYREFRELHKFPETVKFLAMVTATFNGGPVIISLMNPYMTGELDSVFGEQAAFYLLCLSAIVLLFGLVSAYWFSRLMDTGILTFQRGWMVFLSFFLAIDIIVPSFATRERSIGENLLIIFPSAGLIAALGIAWFYSMIWPSFMSLVPYGYGGQYAGIFMFFQAVFSWMEQVIYTVVVQTTNSHRIAFATAAVWCVIALAICSTMDFEKGKKMSRDASERRSRFAAERSASTASADGKTSSTSKSTVMSTMKTAAVSPDPCGA